ncbi:MAG: transposase family protein [Ktedonobacteraceae bacterium]
MLSSYLRQHGILSKINEQVRFARKRFGRYEVIDFLAVLFGYAISGERTLEKFYERLQPFAISFMALFDRDQLPARSTLSRFLAALTEEAVEALRTLFLDDLLARPLTHDRQTGGLVDRVENSWIVFDIDGTREAARQRTLPQTDELPPPFRRLDDVCAPGYRGRKRGEVVRTRTTVSQAQSYQWLGSFGNRGNGRYREELRKGLTAIGRYLTAYHLEASRTLLRLDGQYGTGAVLSDLAGFAFVIRGKEYSVLDHPLVQARLHLPPDQFQQRPESQIVRSLYDCPQVPVGAEGVTCRVVVATHPADKKKSPVGLTREGVVSELFFTALPQQAFTASDVVELYLHRGAFEPLLSDEDSEQDPDRWCSHSAWGQEAWGIVSQWLWNLRLELGHQLHPDPVRTTEFAPAIPSPLSTPPPSAHTAPPSGYAPPQVGLPWKAGRFSGQDFALQPDGTLRCPADQKLTPHEQRREADGGLRVVYGASIRSCRSCPLREQCQWNGAATAKPRQVSVLLHPLQVGSAPLLWRDWSRKEHRRACMQLVRHQCLEIRLSPPTATSPPTAEVILSRAQRAHSRLCWPERLARNARTPTAGPVTIKLFGIPATFAASLGLTTA